MEVLWVTDLRILLRFSHGSRQTDVRQFDVEGKNRNPVLIIISTHKKGERARHGEIGSGLAMELLNRLTLYLSAS